MILSPRWGLGTIRWIWCWLLLVTLLVAQCSRADVLRPPARIPGPQSRPSASSSTSSSSSSSTTTSSSSSSSNRNMKPNPTRFQRQPLQPTGMGLPGLHHQRPGYSPSNRNNPGQQASILRLMTKTYLYLQILPNGTVSATGYESSYYSVLEQRAVDFGKIYIRGVATNQYLCLNQCGKLYGSEKLQPDCIFRENMESSWYNTYTSIRHSTAEKTLYVGISLSTGLACRVRLRSKLDKATGKSMVTLGTNERFVQFFPVRNISLPNGMNLTSLTQINQRIPFAWNSVIPENTGCVPRCNKISDSDPANSQNPAKAKPERHNRRCKDRKKNHRCKNRSKSKKNKKKKEDERRKQEVNPHVEEKQVLFNPTWFSVVSKGPSKRRTSPNKKNKGSRMLNSQSLGTTSGPNLDHDRSLLSNRKDSRLIRHMYRKIRAHPELAQELLN